MEVSTQYVVLVSAVMVVVEVVKRVGLQSRYLPLLALVLGVAGTYLLGGLDVLQGVAVGASAVGIFSGTRATVNG